MNSALRIGIAGANAERGWAKDAHLPALNALPGLRVHAVSARTQAIADRALDYFGAKKAYSNSLELATDPSIDIVAVTVKVPEHRAIVLEAIAAGKHVYCEWPLGNGVEETQTLARAAREARVHVTIGVQALQAPAVRHAAALVRGGHIGTPLSLRVTSPTAGWADSVPKFYAYLNDRANGATPASIPGGHTLAAIEAIIGPYAEFHAFGATHQPKVAILESDKQIARTCRDHIVAIGRHENGCISSLEIRTNELVEPFRFEIKGEKGVLALAGRHLGGYQCAELTVSTSPPASPLPPPVAPGLTGPAANIAEAWACFENDIRTGVRRSPDFTAGVRLAQLVETLDPAPSDDARE